MVQGSNPSFGYLAPADFYTMLGSMMFLLRLLSVEEVTYTPTETAETLLWCHRVSTAADPVDSSLATPLIGFHPGESAQEDPYHSFTCCLNGEWTS
jgi:hypothetical protein